MGFKLSAVSVVSEPPATGNRKCLTFVIRASYDWLIWLTYAYFGPNKNSTEISSRLHTIFLQNLCFRRSMYLQNTLKLWTNAQK